MHTDTPTHRQTDRHTDTQMHEHFEIINIDKEWNLYFFWQNMEYIVLVKYWVGSSN